MRSFCDKLLVAVGRVTIPVLAVAAGWGAAIGFRRPEIACLLGTTSYRHPNALEAA